MFENITRTEQLKYLWSAKQAQDKANELFPNPCQRYNGKGDAFRHAYWNALSAMRIGVSLTQSLTTAHENMPPEYLYNYKENEMDYYNNEVGRSLVINGASDLLQSTLQALNNGSLRYLNNLNSNNCQATVNSQLIPTNQ